MECQLFHRVLHTVYSYYKVPKDQEANTFTGANSVESHAQNGLPNLLLNHFTPGSNNGIPPQLGSFDPSQLSQYLALMNGNNNNPHNFNTTDGNDKIGTGQFNGDHGAEQVTMHNGNQSFGNSAGFNLTSDSVKLGSGGGASIENQYITSGQNNGADGICLMWVMI
jgi:hypothetical protein